MGAAVAQDVQSQYLPRGTDKIKKNISQDSRGPGTDSNPATPKRKSRALPLDQSTRCRSLTSCHSTLNYYADQKELLNKDKTILVRDRGGP
jgi:hypothetical protein